MSPTEPWRNPRPAPTLDEVRHRAAAPSPIVGWLRAWWPAFLWAAVISLASTDSLSSEHTSRIIEPLLHWLFPALSQDSLEYVHHLIRKCAHFVEYFIFFILLYRGIRGTRREPRVWHWSWALVAWLIAAAYSVLDEIHQIFVPSRGPSAWDSLLDTTGAFFALFALFLIYRRFQRASRS